MFADFHTTSKYAYSYVENLPKKEKKMIISQSIQSTYWIKYLVIFNQSTYMTIIFRQIKHCAVSLTWIWRKWVKASKMEQINHAKICLYLFCLVSTKVDSGRAGLNRAAWRPCSKYPTWLIFLWTHIFHEICLQQRIWCLSPTIFNLNYNVQNFMRFGNSICNFPLSCYFSDQDNQIDL